MPRELQRLAAVMFASHANEEQFFEMKRVLECLLPSAKLMPAEPREYEHPLRAAEICWRGREVGRLFELHPSLLQEAGVEGRATLFEVDIEAAQSLDNAPIVYRPLRRYPTSAFDLSVIADLRLSVAAIEEKLTKLAGGQLVSIEFVRQYTGAPLREGQKSVSYRLEIGAKDHTLTNDELSSVRIRLIEGMRAAGYELRV